MTLSGKTEIYIAGAQDRRSGVERVLAQIDLSGFSGASVAIKANYNSADPPPASTHINTLDAICSEILEQKPSGLSLGERSGMGNTRTVLNEMGVTALSRERGFALIVLDELERNGWHEIQAPGLHWSRGFFLANVFARADRVVQTCCLKTHRYVGHFTLSLKNSVGIAAKRVPGLNYDFMNELHGSSYQRTMIAEINKFYRTDLIVLDAVEGFSSGGPDHGKLIRPGIMIAGTDRVAIDAVGVALLRSFGTVPDVMNGEIFELGQIARAAELGVGVTSANQIKLVPLDKAGEATAQKIQFQLDGSR
jgi:uncharacterized protein (DUF362 family)